MARALFTKIERGERLVATDITDLTFFPRGTILMFSSEAWSMTSAVFKTIWKICDGSNGTPNLIGRFLRGGSSSDFTTDGGADSQSITLSINNMPSHSHEVNDPGHAHTTAWGTGWPEGGGNYGGAEYGGSQPTGDSFTDISIQNTGRGQPFTVNTLPKYFTVIYIMKIA
jgi:microcystin-dependent protein